MNKSKSKNKLNTRKGKKHRKKLSKKHKKICKHRKSCKPQIGMGVLGMGKDGCIIDSISCGELGGENEYVAKYLYQDKVINMELNDTLKRLDPSNERFNYYLFPDKDKCIINEDYDSDIQACRKNGKIDTSNLVFQKKLIPLDGKKMTREQYRYLRQSLSILHDNNISHGDLPENVLLNPENNLPVIIDWENAKMNADNLDKQIDYNAFLDNYKISK
jgi:serine/threonine protein kinase